MSEAEKDLSELMHQLRRSIPLKLITPDSIHTQHATSLLVQQRGTEFILYFFEVQQPLFVGTPEEQIESYQKLESVDAVCVSRMVVSIENLQEMLQNLIGSLNQYQHLLNSTDK